MMHPEFQYLNLLQKILDEGSSRMDRTGVGTMALFGAQMRFDLQQAFPLLTTKRVYWKTAFKEILWMLNGGTNIRPLLEQNVHIWSDWPYKKYCDETGFEGTIEDFEQKILADETFAEKWGDLGPVYGKQWRQWKTEDGHAIDQIADVVEQLQNNPTSRRIIFEGWNVGELNQMALPPCHKTYQFFVDPASNRLSGMMYQRSVDAFLGLGFNLSNLALVIHLLAHQTGLEVGELVWVGADTHIYNNHLDQVKEQMSRKPKAWPQIKINGEPRAIWDYTLEDIEIMGYDPHPPIKAPVAV